MIKKMLIFHEKSLFYKGKFILAQSIMLKIPFMSYIDFHNKNKNLISVLFFKNIFSSDYFLKKTFHGNNSSESVLPEC